MQTMNVVRISTPMMHATARPAAISTSIPVTNHQQQHTAFNTHSSLTMLQHLTSPFLDNISNNDCLDSEIEKLLELDSQHRGSLRSLFKFQKESPDRWRTDDASGCFSWMGSVFRVLLSALTLQGWWQKRLVRNLQHLLSLVLFWNNQRNTGHFLVEFFSTWKYGLKLQ